MVSNYPDGFSGIEGEKEEIFRYELGGEIELEDYNKEAADERLLDMTIREAQYYGIYIGGL